MQDHLKKYKKSLLALAAIVSVWIVTATGIDKGLIDEFLTNLVDDMTVSEDEGPPVMALPGSVILIPEDPPAARADWEPTEPPAEIDPALERERADAAALEALAEQPR